MKYDGFRIAAKNILTLWGGGSYIYISLFEGEVRLGKASQRPINYAVYRLLANRRLQTGSSQAHEPSGRQEGSV
jgi:hypothetical protein